MTKEAQRIAIAEACGHKWYWTVRGQCEMGFLWQANLRLPPEEGIGKAWIGQAGESKPMTPTEIELSIESGDFANIAPDYLNDLNAMHDAEKALKDEPRPRIIHSEMTCYVALLDKLTNNEGWHATSSQRAEAFLRTIGKLADV